MTRKTKEAVIEEFRCASIQDAALRVIARKGLDDTTIQDVADEAGIAKGTVYVYFKDREELLARTVDRLYQDLLDELQPAFDSDASFANKLADLARRQVSFFEKHRALFRATTALQHREPVAQKTKSRCFEQLMAKLETLFSEGKREGELRAGLDPRDVAAFYRDAVRGLILRRLDPKTKSRKNADDDAKLLVSILLHGIQSGEKR
jgi:AcrR family transcriptional regulator